MGDESRWVEVSPSQFPHEAEGLNIVRALLPDETPFRAWSNFEFRDSRGRWHEVDLLLLGRGRLHLIELKYYSGVLRGDDQRWARDGRRPEDSPLKLARRKAQYFASKLKDEFELWARETGADAPPARQVIPFVQESVFLHHPDLRCLLREASTINLYGLDGLEDRSNLPGISELIHEGPGRRPIGRNQELILTKLLARIGLVQRRQREAGSWVIEDGAVDSGEGWQDWLASHRVVQQDRGRIRFRVLPASASQEERAATRRVAEHEYRIMSRLQHDGLLRPRDLVESELGIGLVYPYDQEWQRLDLWLAGQENGVPLVTQLAMVRQVGEALQYAHNNRVVHRGLAPSAVRVRPVPGTDDVRVRVGDWAGAGASTEGGTHVGVTSVYGAGSPADGDAAGDVFAAPEGAWNSGADRVRLDVFGFGALAFYLLTGDAPADTAPALKERLRDQQGLDLAIELPQVSSSLRSLVLKATHPAPTQRTPDVATVLAQLAQAERDATTEDQTDPLDAVPDTVLDGRFQLRRRLGQGSTAVGLLVRDVLNDGAECVLKVALDDEAGARLDDEAEVLRQLDSPRVARLLEGPIVVGGRRALLLENAGRGEKPDQAGTLADVLRSRARLSLDLLERYGTDLLDALVVLDRAGVDHRDIKPSNLGVRENRGDRVKHLVLFDFSLTRAAASATQAGTPPYLDPFLTGTRDRYDSAAERYAAAVVLFEMATGTTPTYGDGEADPATVPDEARIDPAMFDPTLAAVLVDFFTTALARDATRRHHTAEALRSAWVALFTGDATTQPDESNDELADRATLTTPLRESGLTARALSALEPYAVRTVGELLTVDAVRLSRLQGVANTTRLQITSRMKQWRTRLGDPPVSEPTSGRVPTPTDAADLLLRPVATPRSPARGGLVRLVLGIGSDLDAFATHAQLGAHLPEPVQQARVSQVLGTLQEKWAADDDARGLLDRLADAVSTRLTELGTVATVAELTRTVLESLAPEPTANGRPTPDERLARGLLRLALERRRAMHRADGSQSPVWLRRRGGVVTLIAEDQALFDVAESLGEAADRLVAAAGDPGRAVVPAARVQSTLDAVLDAAVPAGVELPAGLASPARRAGLAAATSAHTAASGAGELHHRDLAQLTALELTFAGFGGQQLAPEEIRERVRVRFPAVPPLPERPALDAMVAEAGLALVFDGQLRVYRSSEANRSTTGLETRRPTSLGVTSAPVESTGALGVRLQTSLASRSFLTLGVPAWRVQRFVDGAETAYRATTVDLTGALLDALKEGSAAAGLPWDLVRAADAEAPSSRGRRGLQELVRRAWPQVEAAIDQALAAGDEHAPVLLTEAAPLARYDNIALLTRWSDLAAPRRRAVWLVVPQLGGHQGAVIDGQPVPLAAPSQFVALDTEWIDTLAAPKPSTTQPAALKES